MSADPKASSGSPLQDGAAQVLGRLLAGASLEMSPGHPEEVRSFAALLPAGARVYVPHLPGHALEQSHAALKAIRAAGFEPVAHVAARRLASRAELTAFLERAAAEAGLSNVLALGGDEPQQRGPYASAAEMLREGTLPGYGIRQVGLAGYPEGHPRIPPAVIEQALAQKVALLADQGLVVDVVTQFSFAPAQVAEYCAQLERKFPRIPVHVGLAGPSDAATLMRFAQRCGVIASLRTLRAQGLGAMRLITHADPTEQLDAIAHHCLGRRACNVAAVHLYSFGGARKSAAWIGEQIARAGLAARGESPR